MKRSFLPAILAAVAFLGVSLGAAWAQNIPGPDQIRSLVKATMLDFALAVKAKDFTSFYKNIAMPWQAKTSAQELAQIFKSFIDQKIDLTVLDDLEPAYSKKPALDSQGWLVIEGTYPTKPSAVNFILKYIKEGATWKLAEIEVNVTPAGPTLPSKEILKELVNVTVLDLAIAIKAKDFRGFYKTIAKLWKEQTTAEALAENFRSFTDQNLDLTVLQNLEPVFTKAPALDENDWLMLEGYYSSKPSRAYFTMKFLNEDGAWKLAAVDLNVKSEKN
ncbi:MAG: hypothetical protein WCB96_02705 [Candidatus Aminicenantales bacterium]